MSLFGSLYLGDSGLRTSQSALNTVAHNLSNLNTPGYVRQQVANTDTVYTYGGRSVRGWRNQVGTGAKYAECRHVRDTFLDMAYREEYGRSSYYEVSYSAILEIEDILGELDGAAFKNSYSGLWVAMQELSKDPNNTVNMSVLMSKAASFMENAASVYQSFQEYQNNLNKQIKDSVKEINSIGNRIYELNKEIMKIEVGGVENANDLRDERDQLLDMLAGYGNISYNEEPNTAVTVRFNGTSFITEAGVYEMQTFTDKDTGFVTPYWKQNIITTTDARGNKVVDYSGAHVFNLKEEISTAGKTDVGSLRALLLARGDHVANYTDLTVGACTDVKLDKLKISADAYDEKDGLKYYNDYISKSIVMNMQAEFDNIVHAVMTKINEVIADSCDPKTKYLCNEDGSPMQMFEKTTGSAYEKVVLSSGEAEILKAQGVKLYQIYDDDENPVPNMYWKYIEEDVNAPQTLYNCANAKINQKLLQSPSLLQFTWVENSVDYNIGKKFVEAFQEEGIYLNPKATDISTFENCYIDLVDQVGTSGYVFGQLYDFEQLAMEQADNERQTVIGVSSDEELEHMIMYQNAYNAASRYINVINSMLDTLLGMGA
ncbi:MAG: flagellar hook-associated protein FlgK [Lachnospiraceae bacterium]|nr:flagellar hook-associated protein FlgK [Lachnospiraceae bacterium]MDE7274590.1 flagellar hook-associated protein FlgK [Lachnospiraceae bacterium]